MRNQFTFYVLATILGFFSALPSYALICGEAGINGPHLKLSVKESGDEIGLIETNGAYDLRNTLSFQWCDKGHCQQMGRFKNYDIGTLSHWALRLSMDGMGKSYSMFLMTILGGGMALELETMLGTQMIMSQTWFKSIVAKLGLTSTQALWLSTWLTPEGWITTSSIYGAPLQLGIDWLKPIVNEKPSEDLYWDFFQDFNESDQMALILKGEVNSLSPFDCSEIGFEDPEKFKKDIAHFLNAIDIVIIEKRVPTRGEY